MRAYLYDAEGVDRELTLDSLDPAALGAGQLLWVDLDASDPTELDAVARRLELEAETVELLGDPHRGPELLVHRDYFHVSVTEVQGPPQRYRPVLLDCVAGSNWVITSHHEPLEFPHSFDEHFRGDSNVGRFASADFVAALLNEQLLGYGRELGGLLRQIDRVEQLVLRDRIAEEVLLPELVGITRSIGQLRRLLAPHLEIFERLAQPNLSQLLPEASPEGLFSALVRRLERTLERLDTARQMVAGALDLYTTLVAHGTNKVIKLLTVASVTLLPPTLLANLMGMDSVPAALRGATAFWVSVGVMIALVTSSLVVAWRRNWL
jgi:magnesium transporter